MGVMRGCVRGAVSVWDDENVLVVGSGDGCITL